MAQRPPCSWRLFRSSAATPPLAALCCMRVAIPGCSLSQCHAAACPLHSMPAQPARAAFRLFSMLAGPVCACTFPVFDLALPHVSRRAADAAQFCTPFTFRCRFMQHAIALPTVLDPLLYILMQSKCEYCLATCSPLVLPCPTAPSRTPMLVRLLFGSFVQSLSLKGVPQEFGEGADPCQRLIDGGCLRNEQEGLQQQNRAGQRRQREYRRCGACTLRSGGLISGQLRPGYTSTKKKLQGRVSQVGRPPRAARH